MKHVLIAVASCLAVAAVGVACIYALVRWSLAALSSVPPLSWEAAGLVWAFAWGFTAVILLMLAALALILALAEFARRWRLRSCG